MTDILLTLLLMLVLLMLKGFFSGSEIAPKAIYVLRVFRVLFFPLVVVFHDFPDWLRAYSAAVFWGRTST